MTQPKLSRFHRLSKRTYPLLLLLGALHFGAGCTGDPSSPDGGGGQGGDGHDLNDSSCGTSDLNPLNVVELQILEGKPPKAKGGTIRPGIYELTEWRVWLDPLPEGMATEFRRTLLAIEEDGVFRLATKSQTGSAVGSGDYRTSEDTFAFVYECPGHSTPPSMHYTATKDTLTLLADDGQEYFYQRVE